MVVRDPRAIVVCTDLVLRYQIYCKVYELLNPEVGDSLCETLVKAAEVDDFFFPEQVTVSVSATLRSGEVLKGTSTWDPDKFTDGYAIDLKSSGQPDLVDVTVFPPNPRAGQSYNVDPEIICFGSSTTIILSVAGTDGYSDSEFCTTLSCSLNVPGAVKGTVDTIEIRIMNPSLPTDLVRTVVVIFG